MPTNNWPYKDHHVFTKYKQAPSVWDVQSKWYKNSLVKDLRGIPSLKRRYSGWDPDFSASPPTAEDFSSSSSSPSPSRPAGQRPTRFPRRLQSDGDCACACAARGSATVTAPVGVSFRLHSPPRHEHVAFMFHGLTRALVGPCLNFKTMIEILSAKLKKWPLRRTDPTAYGRLQSKRLRDINEKWDDT